MFGSRQAAYAPPFAEATVNNLAYQLLRGNNRSAALEMFRLNVELYPGSANVYDSLSEAYEAGNDTTQAIASARTGLETIPHDTTLTTDTKENLRRLMSERLRRLGASQ